MRGGGPGAEELCRAGGQNILQDDLGMDGEVEPQSWMELRVLVGEWPHLEKDRGGGGTELGDKWPREPESCDRFGRDKWVSCRPIKRCLAIGPSWKMGKEGPFFFFF